jgi:hypothetical protein
VWSFTSSHIRLAVLIHPSCPCPIGFLRNWWLPHFYDEGFPICAENWNVFVGRFKPGPDTSVLEDVHIPGDEIMWTHVCFLVQFTCMLLVTDAHLGLSACWLWYS